MTYRPRPHDHLVEPMFTALVDEEPAPRAPRRLWITFAVLGIVGLTTLFVTVFAAG